MTFEVDTAMEFTVFSNISVWAVAQGFPVLFFFFLKLNIQTVCCH